MIKLSSLLSVLQGAAESGAQAVAQENLRALGSYFQSPAAGSSGSKNPLSDSGVEGPLVPKTVLLQYPTVGEDGPRTHDVHVPLIALAPVTGLHVSELDIEMDLELLELDGEVVAGFPQQRHSILGKDKVAAPNPNARIKIKIAPGHQTPGMCVVVEGYDKALRAQIPT